MFDKYDEKLEVLFSGSMVNYLGYMVFNQKNSRITVKDVTLLMFYWNIMDSFVLYPLVMLVSGSV